MGGGFLHDDNDDDDDDNDNDNDNDDTTSSAGCQVRTSRIDFATRIRDLANVIVVSTVHRRVYRR